MLRILSLILAVACLVTTGCGGNNPPSAPQSGNGITTADAPSFEAGGTPAPQPAPIAQPAPATPPPAASPLRDLAARYLESDGQGGWRKNEKAATELEKLSPEEIALLWPLLKDPQVEVRRGTAVFLLPQFDPANRGQVAAFTALLDDTDRMVRARALDAVKQCSREDQMALLPRLTAMLDPGREDRAANRTAIARLCGALKSDASVALPALQTTARSDPDARVRAAALVAFAQVAAPSHAVLLFATSLADKDASVRLVAAARLRQLGPTAAPAAKELAATLADSSSGVAEAAAEALIRIGATSVEPLASQLSSNSASARKLALACLAKLGPAAKPAVGQIEKCKQDADPQVRQLAEVALKRLAGQ